MPTVSRRAASSRTIPEKPVKIPADEVHLAGDLVVPPDAAGIVLFAHGSGSGHLSPRNRAVAAALQEAGFATLLFDLLTPAEEDVDMESGLLRFDIGFLTRRLLAAAAWTARQPESAKLALGYFGASTGAAAALVAASLEPENVKAVVSRGGRPDLAGDAIAKVQAPTLLLVGGNDAAVLEMNREAAAKMTARHALEVVPGASHLFEEPGTLEEVARRAVRWFSIFLKG